MSKTFNWNEVFPHWGHTIRLPKTLLPYVGSSPFRDGDVQFAERVEETPKIELHVHMEAGVSEQFYQNINLRRKLFEEANMPAKRAPFAAFGDFIKAWVDNSKLVDDESLYSELAIEFVKQRAAQNIVYSEVHVSPLDFSLMRRRMGFAVPLDLATCLKAILSGLQRAEILYPKIVVRLIVDCLWFAKPEEHEEVYQVLNDIVASDLNKTMFGTRFIVAVGLGGPEENKNERELVAFLDKCRALGLCVDVHSGEMVGPEDHRKNVTAVKPQRIAHGISGANEGWFYEHHISVCPLSNLLTGSFKGTLPQHPVKAIRNSRHSFSINSDDPLLFSTTLTLEYVALKNAFDFNWDFFLETQANAKHAALDQISLAKVMK